MSWKVWKQPSERATEELQKGYQKGLNLGNWESAYSSFSSAYSLFYQAGDSNNAELANALAVFCRALISPNAIDNWSNVVVALNKVKVSTIEITEIVSTNDLSQESNLKAIELKARIIKDELKKAEQLEEVAKQYIVFGKKHLLIPLLLEKKQLTGVSLAHKIIAEAAQLRGNEELNMDPKHASEYYRMAALHMKASGELEVSEYLSGKAVDFSTSALCYFCGREVIGKEINFVYMRATVSKFIEKQNASKVLPSNLDNAIVACTGCNSAITNKADEIAKEYYKKMQEEFKEYRQEMEAKLAELNHRISHVASKVR